MISLKTTMLSARAGPARRRLRTSRREPAARRGAWGDVFKLWNQSGCPWDSGTAGPYRPGRDRRPGYHAAGAVPNSGRDGDLLRSSQAFECLRKNRAMAALSVVPSATPPSGGLPFRFGEGLQMRGEAFTTHVSSTP